MAASHESNIAIQFKVNLVPADQKEEKEYLAQGFLPVYAGPQAAGKSSLARVNIGGQAFNMLLSKTTTWEPSAKE